MDKRFIKQDGWERLPDEAEKTHFAKVNRRLTIGATIFFILAGSFLLLWACSLRTGDTFRSDTITQNDTTFYIITFRK